MNKIVAQELIEPVDISDFTVIGQAVMVLEKDEWNDYLDLIDYERRGLSPPLAEEEIDAIAQSYGDEYVLPLHDCIACGNALDANEHCKTCGFDIYPSGNPDVNWAEANAEL